MVKKSPQNAPNYWFIVLCIGIAVLIAIFFSARSPYGGAPMKAGNLYGQAIAGSGTRAAATLGPAITSCKDSYLTKVNSCSKAKPKFCTSSGQIISDSVRCGCPAPQIPVTGGGCAAVAPYEMKTYNHDDLDSKPDYERYTLSASRFPTGTLGFNPYYGPKYLTPSNTLLLALPNNGLIFSDASVSFSEEQHALLFGYTEFDSTDKVVKSFFAKTGYEAVFTPGLPLCLDGTSTLASCPASKQLKNSNIKIWLLGSSWYARDYGLSQVTGNVTNMTLVREDGKIMLLSDGSEIQIVGQPGAAKNWKVKINSGKYPYAYITPTVASIQLYNDIDQSYEIPVSSTLNPGDSISLIKYPLGYKFNYYGLEIPDYDALSFSLEKTQSLTQPNGRTATGNFIYVHSGLANAFQFGESSVPDVYVGVNGSFFNESANTYQPITGVFFYLDASGYAVPTISYYLPYHIDSNNYVYMRFQKDIPTNTFQVLIPEVTDDYGGTISVPSANWHTNLLINLASHSFVYPNMVGYSFGGTNSFAGNEAGFVSYRGTVVANITNTTVSLNYPIRVVHALYSLAYGGDDIAWTSTSSAPAQK